MAGSKPSLYQEDIVNCDKQQGTEELLRINSRGSCGACKLNLLIQMDKFKEQLWRMQIELVHSDI